MHQAGYRADLGDYLPKVKAALQDVHERDFVKRIWAKDHTVWSADPTEITNRLGWLTVTGHVQEQVGNLNSLAQEIKNDGYRHILLVGMGGSSLGTEVLRRVIGSEPGFPELIVLDSTLPAWIQSVVDRIDLRKTLFLISSKSGSTLETMSFYKFFRGMVDENSGAAEQNFIAITCSGTPLDKLAQECRFRHTILNPEDVGSRYSVLSLLGMGPASLAGMDVERLTKLADCLSKKCGPDVPAADNTGVWLGTVMGTMALNGRDKLTLMTSPAFESFGLWAEQLLAESTGKEAKGIVPIVGEPLMAPEHYGDDRFFVFMRLKGDDNANLEQAMEVVASSGHPWVSMEIDEKYQLGAEFYRWEFATAVAGAILNIQPFDQPDVQLAKDMTDSVLREYRETGSLPYIKADISVPALLAEAKQGNYVAIMAYAHQTPAMDEALAQLRRRITERYHVPVTLGYGPRILHSTGQMHKGGANTGLFIQVTTANTIDLYVPEEDFSFGVLVQAQATADLQALQNIDRRVAHVHLSSVDQASLNDLAQMPI